MKREDVLKLFPGRLRDILGRANLDFDRLQEIRLRVNKPLILLYDGREVFLDGFGRQWSIRQKGYTVTPEDISGTLEYISSYSMYAYEEELRQGYLTVQGGHRVGVAGRAVVEGEKLKSVQYISFINVRIAHQIPGCAEQLLPYVVEGGGVYHTLIGAPLRQDHIAPGADPQDIRRYGKLPGSFRGGGGRAVRDRRLLSGNTPE